MSMLQRIKDTIINVIDRTYPLGGRVDADGGATRFEYGSNSDNKLIFGLSKFSSTVLSSKKIVDHVSEKAGQSEHFTDLLVAMPETSKLIGDEVVNEIREYLGWAARLDIVTLFAMKTFGNVSEKINDSGLYHHDSVGHRLKFFFPLNLEGNQLAPTEYLLGSHRLNYKTFTNSVANDGVRIESGLLAQYLKTRKNIIVPFGTGFMFDTNGIHRGCYESETMIRLTIQFEFSALKTGVVRGYIGPRRFDLHPDAADWFVGKGLLRKRCLKRLPDGTYRHSSIFDRVRNESRILDLIS